MSDTTFMVPAENIDTLKSRIDRINKKVERLMAKGYPVKPGVRSPS